MRQTIAKVCVVVCATVLVALTWGAVSSERDKTLHVYFLDMVGGASTLIVTPLGESVLVDTGSMEPKHRDADRIYQATQHAKLKQIDHLITTHFHSDHFGGLSQLSKMIPIKKFYDKGAPAPQSDRDKMEKLYSLYQEVTGGRAQAIKVGDDVSLRNDPEGNIPPIKLHCVAAEKRVEGFDGDVDAQVPGFEIREPDVSDNARSIALVLTYGKFRLFAGGDITWNVEHHLAHPTNRIGPVDVYQVTHHGLDLSNNPLLVRGLDPVVCIAMNGPRKGIQPKTFAALKQLPSLKAIYQVHYNAQYGSEGNTGREFIANADDPQKGEMIRLSVNPDKSNYTVVVGSSGSTREYPIRGKN
ncbi:MBL fold metallo-hydrolase [Candidatus Sumerlaeota bacterium]|nr:MBL fold metallo-hydrolase [Candidatus Sumerlaeota bacterium]